MLLRKQDGFTLIELMMAVAILLASMTAVLAMYSWCTTEVRRARQRTLAAACGQQMMEMMAASLHSLTAYDGFTTRAAPADANPALGDWQRWQRCVDQLSGAAAGRISVRDDGDIPFALRVDLTIQYENYGRAASLRLTRSFPHRMSRS